MTTEATTAGLTPPRFLGKKYSISDMVPEHRAMNISLPMAFIVAIVVGTSGIKMKPDQPDLIFLCTLGVFAISIVLSQLFLNNRFKKSPTYLEYLETKDDGEQANWELQNLPLQATFTFLELPVGKKGMLVTHCLIEFEDRISPQAGDPKRGILMGPSSQTMLLFGLTETRVPPPINCPQACWKQDLGGPYVDWGKTVKLLPTPT